MQSVGIFSFARYRDDSPSEAVFLRRCCMVLVHEVTHLFGVKHCIYASCLMNGSNSIEEEERRPFMVCPVDCAKLQDSMHGISPTGLDLVDRERQVLGNSTSNLPSRVMRVFVLTDCRGGAGFLDRYGMDEDAELSRERLTVMGVEATAQPQPEPEPEPEAEAEPEAEPEAGTVEAGAALARTSSPGSIFRRDSFKQGGAAVGPGAA